jgi:hypothetical protein
MEVFMELWIDYEHFDFFMFALGYTTCLRIIFGISFPALILSMVPYFWSFFFSVLCILILSFHSNF